MVYDRRQAESILARAQELDAPSSEALFDTAALQQLADELDVSRQALTQAIDEMTTEDAGLLSAEAGALVDQPVETVTESVGAYLRLRGLTSTGWSVWEQSTGWWPDVYRYRAHTPVAVSVSSAGTATRVRLIAHLDRVARAHVVFGVLAPLWLAMLVAGGGVSGLGGWLVPAVAWVAGAIGGFFYRREAIRRRLANALVEVARPDYRMVPW
ncbi:MAG: hypothetical protein OER12_03810 [Acidimicrobiia bacterium]|nr:hypothetical protein [Acidimicrobiia bacterium]